MSERGQINAGMYQSRVQVMEGTIDKRGRSWKGGLHGFGGERQGPQIRGRIFIATLNNRIVVFDVTLVLVKCNDAPRIAKRANPYE